MIFLRWQASNWAGSRLYVLALKVVWGDIYGYILCCDRQWRFVGRSREEEERLSWDEVWRRVQDWRWVSLPIENFITRRHPFSNLFVFPFAMEIELITILFSVRWHQACFGMHRVFQKDPVCVHCVAWVMGATLENRDSKTWSFVPLWFVFGGRTTIGHSKVLRNLLIVWKAFFPMLHSQAIDYYDLIVEDVDWCIGSHFWAFSWSAPFCRSYKR